MIKRLQRKFVLIAMGSLFIVVVVIIGSANLITLNQMDQKAEALLTLLAENNGKFPDFQKNHPKKPEVGLQLTPETQFETRYFFVRANAEDNTITEIDTGHIAAVSSSDAREYAQDILENRSTSGYRGAYKYLVVEKSGEKLLVFVDCGTQLQSALSFLVASCGIALLSMLVVFLLVSVLSRRAIRPVIESMEKQKQFITDAGHEIKTPLAIISANTDVLELNNGRSEWTDSIRRQTERLSGLVKNLLALSKLEEDRVALTFSEFSLSDAVWDAASPFETLADTQGKHLELNIQPGLSIYGDEGSIRQLVSILLDNAVKYADKHGEIHLSLSKAGKNTVLTVSNPCESVTEENLDRLFDRFYRTDSSRTRETGGYGIGLSIAKAVAEAHKGKIDARKERGNLIFTVTLP